MPHPEVLFESPVEPTIEPTFETVEDVNFGLSNVKVNQRIRVFINFQVIEKTRSFTIVRINSVYPVPTKRVV